MTTMVSPIARAQGHEFLNKLEAAGLDSQLAQRVVDSKGNDLAAKVVRFIANGGFEPTTSQKRAREVMGENMFGVEDAIKYFGVNPSKFHLAALSEVPWSEEALTFYKDTHILVAVFPLSVLDIRGIRKGRGDLFYSQDWYNKEAFAKDKSEIGWCLVRKTPVPDSISKTWDEQQALLGNNEETPSAQVVVYTIIGHFLATGNRLFERTYVRTSSVDSDGGRVCVGVFDHHGLDVSSWWDGDRYGKIGLSSARKS